MAALPDGGGELFVAGSGADRPLLDPAPFAKGSETAGDELIRLPEIQSRRVRRVKLEPFTGMAVGVDRLAKIVEEKLHTHAHKRGNSKTGASGQTLAVLFRQWDNNKSGCIDKDEFVKMVENIGIQNVAQSDVDGLFKRWDADGSGSLDYGEFSAKFSVAVSHQRGIVDYPSTRECAEVRSLSEQQKLRELQVDATRKWQENRMTLDKFLKLCEADAKGHAPTGDVSSAVTSKLAIGTGNMTPLDGLLAGALVGRGRVDVARLLAALMPGDNIGPRFPKKSHLFTGMAVGVDRLAKIVEEKLHKHSHKRGNSQAGASGATLVLMFRQWDDNKSGCIDKDEFVKMVEDIGIQNVAQSDVDGLFKRWDADGSGSLDYGEFTKRFSECVSHQRGIVDYPSTRECAEVHFLPAEEKLDILKIDATRKWQENRMTLDKFLKLCEADAKGHAPTGDVSSTITSKLAIGIGNMTPLDGLLAGASVGRGRVDVARLLAALMPDMPLKHATSPRATPAKLSPRPPVPRSPRPPVARSPRAPQAPAPEPQPKRPGAAVTQEQILQALRKQRMKAAVSQKTPRRPDLTTPQVNVSAEQHSSVMAAYAAKAKTNGPSLQGARQSHSAGAGPILPAARAAPRPMKSRLPTPGREKLQQSLMQSVMRRQRSTKKGYPKGHPKSAQSFAFPRCAVRRWVQKDSQPPNLDPVFFG
jgi:Ca2+-binding EF-hand superfamily protein